MNNEKSSEERRKPYKDSAFQLFLSATTHQQISGIWYTWTFVQSQDAFAFLEYAYHRLSSIRSLAKLRALAITASSLETTIAEAVLEGIAKCGELIDKAAQQDQQIERLEFKPESTIYKLLRGGLAPLLKDKTAADILSDSEEELMKRHRRELRSLHRAWARSEVILRTQIPAEQLLHWCDEVLGDDLVHRCNRLVINYNQPDWKPGGPPPEFKPEYHVFQSRDNPDELIDHELEKEITEFRHYLQDLQAKLWIELADYETCIDERRRHLVDNPPEDVKNELEEDDAFIGSCGVLQCHRLLDIVNCKIKNAQESTFADEDLIEKREAAIDLMKKVEDRLEALNPDATAKAENLFYVQAVDEAWLYLLHLRAECQLGRVSMFSHDGFTGDPENWIPKAANLDEVIKTIADGLLQIRTRDARTYEAPRSVVVDSATDGALYLPYRSVFHMLYGRAEWLTEDANKDEAFQRAFRYFEMSRGGLGDHSPLMFALIELYAVEAHLARARNVLFNTDAEDAFNRAHAMYESARSGLQRARESLLASRRNAIWQKLFFQLVTQYHSDRLLLGYTRLEENKGKAEKAEVVAQEGLNMHESEPSLGHISRRFLLRLRRAYQSLLTALELYLPLSNPLPSLEYPERLRWPYRMWWELTLCGYATGRLALEAIESDLSEDEADEYIVDQLKWLNQSAGIDTSELNEIVKKQFGLLKKEYEKIRQVTDTTSATKQALKRRRELIKQVMSKTQKTDAKGLK